MASAELFYGFVSQTLRKGGLWVLGLLSLITFSPLLLAEEASLSQILYHESFDHYGVHAPGFTRVCAVAERPQSLKYLEFRPVEGRESMVFDEAHGPRLRGGSFKDGELTFRFRFPKESTKGFEIHVFFGSETSPVTTHRVQVVSATEGVPPLLPNVWYTARLRIHRGRLEFFLNPSGEWQRLEERETEGNPCVGFNLSGKTAVDFERFLLQSPPPSIKATSEPSPPPAAPSRLPAPLDRKFDSLKGGERVVVTFGLGSTSAVARVFFGWEDGTTSTINVSVAPSSWSRKTLEGEKVITQKCALPDAVLVFQEDPFKTRAKTWGLQRHVRPDPRYYDPEAQMELAAKWDRLPAASHHPLQFEVRPSSTGTAIWIDRRYAGRIDKSSRLVSVAFHIPAGGFFHHDGLLPPLKDPRWLPLDVGGLTPPAAMKDAQLSLPTGPCEIRGIPMIVQDGNRSADVSVVREHLGSYLLECDGYLSRHAFCGVPESLLFSVPHAQYCRAWILCAAENDPAKDAILTARLTRFPPAGNFAGRGPAIADTAVTLPRESVAPPAVSNDARGAQVGTVTYRADAKTLTAPLWLIEVPLKVGEIQDVLFQEPASNSVIPSPYLDFEFLGKTDFARQQLDRSRKPDPRSISGVHVFGVTLEKSDIEMEVIPASPGNAYELGERAEMTVVLRASSATACQLRWEIRDLDERIVSEGEQAERFDGATEKKIVTPLATKVPGWYRARFILFDGKGRRLIEHPASFVILDKDTRTAGYESPYHSWWFGGAHGGARDLNLIGPLFLRAGIRKTTIFGLQSEEAAASWKLTLAQLPYQSIDPSQPDEETLSKLGTKIAQWRKQFPHADQGVVLHESYSGPFPIELLDEPTPARSAEEIEKDRLLMRRATLNARVYRERFPDVKTVVGNCGNSLAVLAGLFRNRFPHASIDFLGNEEVGQTVPPENSVALSNWMLRDLARRFGCEAPVNACYEWVCRTDRDLGPRRRAEWGVRDNLIAHAWRQKLIPVPGLVEPSTSYFNTVWGSGWMLSRYPQLYPNPSYAATATLTRVLDGAEFVRMLPTGSFSVYALEFKRGQAWIYALWTARGRVEMHLAFPSDAPLRVTGLYGESREVAAPQGQLSLSVNGAATYVHSAVGASAITLGLRTFPEDRWPDGTTATVADAMRDAADWRVAPGADPRIENPAAHRHYPPFRRPGRYELRTARDVEKGDCLEIELIKAGRVPTLMEEYAILRPKVPLPVPGKPDTLGVWAKGNSGWGRLMWEFQDAEGEVWLSCGTGGYGCSVQDWPCQAALNFDGWNLLRFPLVQSSPVHLPTAGDVSDQWLSSGGNRKIDYPIQLTGLVVSMTRKTLNLVEMVDVPTVVRFRDLCVSTSEQATPPFRP